LQGILSTVLGITIEKGQQRSDWGKRPLTGQQLLYAVNDVSYLHKLYVKILELLQQKNLLWIFEQECAALTQKEAESEEEKLKSLFNSCSEYDFFVITSIYHFREKIAQQLNKPPSQVFHNDVLWDLLKNPQSTLAAWLGLKGIHPYAKKEEFLEELETLINNTHALAQKKGLAKEKKFSGMTAEQRKALQDERDAVFMPIRNFLAQAYGEQGVTLILSKKLMDSLVSGNLKISQLKPYQQKLLIETAQKLEINLEKYN
jgi:ribonuclease D